MPIDWDRVVLRSGVIVDNAMGKVLGRLKTSFEELGYSANQSATDMQELTNAFRSISGSLEGYCNGDSEKTFRYLLLLGSDDKRKRRRARRWLKRDKERSVKNVKHNT